MIFIIAFMDHDRKDEDKVKIDQEEVINFIAFWL